MLSPTAKKLIFFLVFLIIIALVSNLLWFLEYQKSQASLEEKEKELTKLQEKNQKQNEILSFTEFFIDRVLRTEGAAISVPTRIALDEHIFSLEDQELIEQWKAFTLCQNEKEAQVALTKFLSTLMRKGRA